MPFPVTYFADRSLLSFEAAYVPWGSHPLSGVSPNSPVSGAGSRSRGARDESSAPQSRAAPEPRRDEGAASSEAAGRLESAAVAAYDAIDRLSLWTKPGRSAFTVSVQQLAAAAEARTAGADNKPRGHLVITVDGGRYLLPVEGQVILPPPPPPEREPPQVQPPERDEAAAKSTKERAALRPPPEGDGPLEPITVDRRGQDHLTNGLAFSIKAASEPPAARAQKAYGLHQTHHDTAPGSEGPAFKSATSSPSEAPELTASSSAPSKRQSPRQVLAAYAHHASPAM